MTARYVAFEGVDGAGKSTLIQLLASHLLTLNITPILLSEPTQGRWGRALRQALRDGTLNDREIQSKLFTSDRREHVRKKIKPLLHFVKNRSGFMILQSRSYLSAAAYQSPSDSDFEMTQIVERQRAFAPTPDLFVILDVPVEVAVKRLKSRQKADLLEVRQVLRAARRRYRRLAVLDPDRCRVINAVGSSNQVLHRVLRCLELSKRI